MFLKSLFQITFWLRLPIIVLVGDSLFGLGTLAHELQEFHSELGQLAYQWPCHVQVELMIIAQPRLPT